MKNYKFLMPILLVCIFGLSIYMLYSGRVKAEEEYQALLDTARSYREQKIYVDAESYYLAALDKKESLALHIEVAELYQDMGDEREAFKRAEMLIETYREEPEAYEFITDIYMSEQKYAEIFSIYDVMKDLKIESKKIQAIIDDLEYEVFYTSTGYSEVGSFSEGLCQVKGESLWGYVNAKGQSVIPMQYTKSGAFSNGLASVVDYIGDAYYIDTAGNKKKVINNIDNVVEVGLWKGDTFSVFNGQTWAFYKEDGNKISDNYEEASNLGNGYAAVKKSGDWYIMDADGKTLFDTSYDMVVMDEKKVIFRNGVFFVKEDGVYYMLDQSGKKVTETAYEDVDMFRTGDLAAVKLDGKWGYINASGKFVIEPKYDEAKSFSNGFAAIKVGETWGYINENEEVVIEPQYEDAAYFNEKGSAFIQTFGTWKLVCFYKYIH